MARSITPIDGVAQIACAGIAAAIPSGIDVISGVSQELAARPARIVLKVEFDSQAGGPISEVRRLIEYESTP